MIEYCDPVDEGTVGYDPWTLDALACRLSLSCQSALPLIALVMGPGAWGQRDWSDAGEENL